MDFDPQRRWRRHRFFAARRHGGCRRWRRKFQAPLRARSYKRSRYGHSPPRRCRLRSRDRICRHAQHRRPHEASGARLIDTAKTRRRLFSKSPPIILAFVPSMSEVERLALDLPENQRAVLAAHLLGSLASVLHDEDEGIAEALRRDAELDAESLSVSLKQLDEQIERRYWS